MDRTDYDADRNFDGGRSFYGNMEISNTEDDMLYLTERNGDFSYSLPVTVGKTYRIKFHLAEVRGSVDSVGLRVFNIFVEGQLPEALKNVDIYAEAGGRRPSISSTLTWPRTVRWTLRSSPWSSEERYRQSSWRKSMIAA